MVLGNEVDEITQSCFDDCRAMAFALVAGQFLGNKIDLSQIRDASEGEDEEVALEAAGDGTNVVGMLGQGLLALGGVEVEVVCSATTFCPEDAVSDDVGPEDPDPGGVPCSADKDATEQVFAGKGPGDGFDNVWEIKDGGYHVFVFRVFEWESGREERKEKDNPYLVSQFSYILAHAALFGGK